VTVNEVAPLLRVSDMTVLINQRDLPAVRVGRRSRLREEDVSLDSRYAETG
jgi:excisionase family DNA binding protein